MTRKYYNLTLSAFMVVVTTVLFLMMVAWASAASLRICFVEPPPDIVTAPAFLNASPFHPDLLAGSVTGAAGVRCNTVPIPATVVRGTDQAITMKYTNALQEVSAASNAKTFRLPSTPAVPVIDSVQIVVP